MSLPGPDHRSRRRGDTGGNILVAVQRVAAKPLGSRSTSYNKEGLRLIPLPGPGLRNDW